MLPTGTAERFLDRFDPSRPSSGSMGVAGSDGRCVLTAAADAKPTIGEYGRTFGVGAGVNDET